jgi:hypothetical protein
MLSLLELLLIFVGMKERKEMLYRLKITLAPFSLNPRSATIFGPT